MGAHDPMHEREAQAEASVPSGRRRVALGELFEDRLEAVGGDPDALIRDPEVIRAYLGQGAKKRARD